MKKSNLKIISIILFILVLFSVIYYFKAKTGNNNNANNLLSPKSYREVYKAIRVENRYLGGTDIAVDSVKNESAPEQSTKDYSKTNVQVENIDEADIIKTDGDYIYVILGSYLNIIKVDKDNMNVLSKIKASSYTDDSNYHYIEMYVTTDKLIVIKNIYERSEDHIYYDGKTSAVIFDITDKSNPKKINELSQSGYYVSSRLIGNYLYLVTNQYVYKYDKENIKSYIPTVSDKLVAVNDILILPKPSNSFTNITGININNANKHVSSKSILGNSNDIYVDDNNIYVVASDYSRTNNNTNIVKFDINNGEINFKVNNKVKGTILNQFSMDEYNGYFRIVTTDYNFNRFIIDDVISPNDEETTTNNLYVLDENLNLVSKIEGLAKGERIYSVRFDKDISYFVTFKQIDPLFVVDLSNPLKPIIKTELKIPGFSEYLHVYNDKYLFGLGKDADENGRVISLKISMFDISDKTNVTEKYKTKIDNEMWSEASYNHKAIIISKDRGLIAFPLSSSYVIYKFKDGVGFEKLKEIKNNNETEYYYYYGDTRGLYIDEYLYVISMNKIQTLNLNTLKEGKILEIETEKELYYVD